MDFDNLKFTVKELEKLRPLYCNHLCENHHYGMCEDIITIRSWEDKDLVLEFCGNAKNKKL